jgi:hypothetical protein
LISPFLRLSIFLYKLASLVIFIKLKKSTMYHSCVRGCEYTMILQTIMLTNVLIYNDNDSYVCNSILYVRTLPSVYDLIYNFIRSLFVTGFCTVVPLQSIVLHNICIWYKVYTFTCSAFINVWHNALISCSGLWVKSYGCPKKIV